MAWSKQHRDKMQKLWDDPQWRKRHAESVRQGKQRKAKSKGAADDPQPLTLEEKRALVSKLQREIAVESADKEALLTIERQLPAKLTLLLGKESHPLLMKMLADGWEPRILWTRTDANISESDMELQDWLGLYTLTGAYTIASPRQEKER